MQTKTTMRYHFIPARVDLNFKIENYQVLVRIVEQLECLHIADGK
jgi:hypothetical protein